MQNGVLLYLHGLGSSGRSDTGMFLREHYASLRALACPDYRPQFFHESVRMIDTQIEQLRQHGKPIAVLGSSMGGWHALHAQCRNPDITVLALNPVVDPAVLTHPSEREYTDESAPRVDWPETTAQNFPAVPVTQVDASRVRLLIGLKDDVVPPEPTIALCKQQHWSHRLLPWGHRAEFGRIFAQEINELLERARSPSQ